MKIHHSGARNFEMVRLNVSRFFSIFNDELSRIHVFSQVLFYGRSTITKDLPIVSTGTIKRNLIKSGRDRESDVCHRSNPFLIFYDSPLARMLLRSLFLPSIRFDQLDI